MGQRLLDRVAIVTGAADGMGLAITDLFTKEGAKVLATDINEPKLRSAHANNAAVKTLAIDITDNAAAEKIVSGAVAEFGHLDIVVNAAGIFQFVAVDDITREHWDRVMAVNLTAPMALCLRAIPELKKGKAGRIINIASINAKVARAGMAAYTASKHGLAGFTISLAVELGKFGITANTINPGIILTGITRPYMDDPVWRRHMETKNVVGRIGQADEIAHAALYLAEATSGFTTGHGLTVDGGCTAGYDDSGLVGDAHGDE